MSTLEPRNSSTILRESRTRSESVLTFMPASALRAHEGTSTREPSSSTTHTRQALTGVRLSAKQSVGVSTPSARSASRIVEPSGTRTALPSTSSSTRRLGGGERNDRHRGTSVEDLQPVDRRVDRVRGRLAETADRRVAHHLTDLADQGELVGERSVRATRDHARERLLLPNGPDPARDALPTRLVAEERGDPEHDVGQVDVLVEHHHDARAQRDARRLRVLEREPQVEVVRRDERACRAAQAAPPSAPCRPEPHRPARAAPGA